MDVAIIVTYRCNARCTMCHSWKYSTPPSEEISVDIIKRLPGI